VGNQRQKLLEAFYNDALPSDLLKVEQARITSEIEIARRVVETNLDVTIEFAKHCRSMYLQADPRVRPRTISRTPQVPICSVTPSQHPSPCCGG